MNPKTSQSFIPINCDDEISTSHLVVGGSLPSSFPYVFIGLFDTNPKMSSSPSVDMSSTAPPPFTYHVSSISGSSAPSTSRVSTSPSSLSPSGSRTTFHFGVGPSSVIGSGVSSTTTKNIFTSTSHL